MQSPDSQEMGHFEREHMPAHCSIPPDECISDCLPAQRPLQTSAFITVRGDKSCKVTLDDCKGGCAAVMWPLPNYFRHLFTIFYILTTWGAIQNYISLTATSFRHTSVCWLNCEAGGGSHTSMLTPFHTWLVTERGAAQPTIACLGQQLLTLLMPVAAWRSRPGIAGVSSRYRSDVVASSCVALFKMP